MKKLASFFAASAVAASILVACSPSQEEAGAFAPVADAAVSCQTDADCSPNSEYCGSYTPGCSDTAADCSTDADCSADAFCITLLGNFCTSLVPSPAW